MREYKTAEVAKIVGIHPNTVRFYEEWGLITKPERKENGYRVFTELQIQQIQLARTAFQIEILQNGLRKKMLHVVKASAQGNFDDAILLIQEYIAQIQRERANAEEAIKITQDMVSGAACHKDLCMKRKEASKYLGVTMDSLRNWEMNGLLTIKRKQNGYRIYTDEDICRLKIIRSLRCANYSLESILRMLQQLSNNPNTDIREVLNTPDQSEDIVSVCDSLLLSLSAAEENACKIMTRLQEMKERFL